MDPDASHDPIDNAVRAWVVGIQPNAQAQVVSQQLWAYNLVRRPLSIVGLRRNRRNNFVEKISVFGEIRNAG
jgi:hypothetical protein